MAKLNFNHETLLTVGNKVVDLSERTKQTVNNIEQEIEELRTYWEGTDNQALLDNMNEEITEIKKLLDNYEVTGNNIKNMANGLRDNMEDNANYIKPVEF